MHVLRDGDKSEVKKEDDVKCEGAEPTGRHIARGHDGFSPRMEGPQSALYTPGHLLFTFSDGGQRPVMSWRWRMCASNDLFLTETIESEEARS